MPCFIRITRRLGISLPSDSYFNEWFEGELRLELDAATHEDLNYKLTYLELYQPEELKEIIKQILERRQKLSAFWREDKVKKKEATATA